MFFINNKRLVPAPVVGINKNFIFTPDGRPISSTVSLSIKGTLLPNRGSPSSTGWHTNTTSSPNDELFNNTDSTKFDCLLAKEELLRGELSVTGVSIRFEPTGLTAVTAYGKIKSMSFDPDLWVIRSNYNIEFEAGMINRGTGNFYEDTFGLNASGLFLTACADNVTVSEREDGTGVKDITRALTATSNAVYGSGAIPGSGVEPWMNAKAWCLDRLAQFPIVSGDYYLTPTGTQYNVITTESVDRFGGTYSLNQRYIYNVTNYTEQRSVSRTYEYNLTGNEGPSNLRIVVNGTIQGLDPSNIAANKIANARTYYNMIATGIANLYGASGSATTNNYTEDLNQGSLTYSFNYTNATGSTYRHDYDVNYQVGEDGKPQLTIAGSIEGYTVSSYWQDTQNKFNLAVSGWQVVKPTLKSLATAYNTVIGGTGTGGATISSYFTDYPINKSTSFNKPNGVINYSYVFGFAGSGNAANTYIDEYTVELNSPNSPGTTTNAGYLRNATINGKIQGVNNSNIDDPTFRFNNAAAGFSTVVALAYTRANEYSTTLLGANSPALTNRILNKAVTYDKVGGNISYVFTYNNYEAPASSSVAVQDVTVDDVNPVDVFVEQAIPGRTAGPIFQDIGTLTSKRRSISIAMTLYPKSGSAYWAYSDRDTIFQIASGVLTSYIPAGTRKVDWWITGNSEKWDPKNGFYTLDYAIVYR